MNVQLITERQIESASEVTINSFTRPIALDDFDYNIIDLSSKELWNNDGPYPNTINQYGDICSLEEMIKQTRKSCVIFLLPQNYEYNYCFYCDEYTQHKKIKDLIVDAEFIQLLETILPYSVATNLIYEPTYTSAGILKYSADFHFVNQCGETITKSDKSEKITTIRIGNNRYFTTLDICRFIPELLHFINSFLIECDIENAPQWVRDYSFNDDSIQRELISENQKKISGLKKMIEDSENILAENNRFKSILFSNGDALVDVVFDILEQLMDYDLSGFKDIKGEDFLIKKGNDVFIGEIKGITSNVKNEFISQLDYHCQTYIDDYLTDEHSKDNIFGILIVNPFRTKKLEDREPVNERQIKLAERNGSLIIETKTLLKVFELYKKDIIKSDKVIQVFKQKTGLLSINDFN